MTEVAAQENCSCYHCGLSMKRSDSFVGELGEESRLFCCPACRAVASTIYDSGLGSFYQFSEPTGTPADETLVQESYAGVDSEAIRQQYVELDTSRDEPIAAASVLIGGIHCAACVWLLEKYLAALPGVESVSVSLSEQHAYIRWRAHALPLSQIFRTIARLGYEPQLYTPDTLAQLRRREHHRALRRLGVAGIAMMQVGMFAIALYAGALQGIEPQYRDYLRWISALVATPVVFYSATPFFVGAWRGLKTRAPGMDLPVSIAIGLAYFASLHATVTGAGEVYFDSVAMFTFLLLTGRYIEMRARHRGGQVTSDLNSLLPALVTRVTQGDGGEQQETVSLLQVAVGDRLRVKAGQVIPVDGEVVSGRGSVNESQLTGEFMPITRLPGDEVLAGSINESGVMTIETRAVGAGLKLQVINRLLHKARAFKPHLAQLADRLASGFVLGVLLCAAVVYLYWSRHSGPELAFQVALSVLVVSCPCALSLATPTALAAATNRLRQLGLLVTNPDVWEKTSAVTDVICDKTGTLTRGALSLRRCVVVAEWDQQRCLQLAAALEAYSDHPIARAFAEVPGADLALAEVDVDEGRGVQARWQGRTWRIGASEYVAELAVAALGTPPSAGQWIVLGGEAGPLCWIELEDELRADADQCVAALKQADLQLHLLSGDSSGSAQRLAQQLGFDDCRAGVTPAQKLDYLAALQSAGRRVLVLGDGLNDVPVLAAADVSVAMSNASNLAKTEADTIALSGRLSSVLQLVELAQRTRGIIRQNLGWALGYNILAIPLAAMGLVPPYLAALGMSISSLVVVINAQRLQRQSRGLAPQPQGEVAYG